MWKKGLSERIIILLKILIDEALFRGIILRTSENRFRSQIDNLLLAKVLNGGFALTVL